MPETHPPALTHFHPVHQDPHPLSPPSRRGALRPRGCWIVPDRRRIAAGGAGAWRLELRVRVRLRPRSAASGEGESENGLLHVQECVDCSLRALRHPRELVLHRQLPDAVGYDVKASPWPHGATNRTARAPPGPVGASRRIQAHRVGRVVRLTVRRWLSILSIGPCLAMHPNASGKLARPDSTRNLIRLLGAA